MASPTIERRTDLFVFDESERETGDGSTRHYPALDGLRGIAVLAVLLYHGGFTVAGRQLAQGGFLGVDAFFVLSGFLITGLLLNEWQSRQGIALLRFWGRRARRLLPALFLALLLVCAYAVATMSPDGLYQVRGDMLASEFYIANWWFIFTDVGYFDQFFVSPVRHLWSLAIEEQFYVIWPLIILAVLRRWREPRMVMWTASLIAVASMLWMALGYIAWDWSIDRLYYGTDTRLQSMAIGGALAAAARQGLVARTRLSTWILNGAAAVASVALAVAWSQTGGASPWLYTGGFCVLAILVAIVILSITQNDRSPNPVRGALSIAPLRWLGLISYGVYLYHWPIFLWLDAERTGMAGNKLLLAQILVTLAAAIPSYLLIELPIRRGRLDGSPRYRWWWVPLSFALIAAVILFATRAGRPSLAFTAEKTGEGRPTPVVESGTAPLSERPARIMLIGDSVAYTIGIGFEGNDQTASEVALWNQAVLYCELIDGPRRELSGVEADGTETCRNWREDWTAAMGQFSPDAVVLSVGAWEIFDRQVDGEWLTFGSAEYDAAMLDTLQQIVDAIATDSVPLVLLTTPSFERQPGGDTTLEWTPEERERTAHLNRLFAEIAEKNPERVAIVDLGGWLCGDDDCTTEIDGVALRADGVHYEAPGAVVVANWLAPHLRQVALWGAGLVESPELPEGDTADPAADPPTIGEG